MRRLGLETKDVTLHNGLRGNLPDLFSEKAYVYYTGQETNLYSPQEGDIVFQDCSLFNTSLKR